MKKLLDSSKKLEVQEVLDIETLKINKQPSTKERIVDGNFRKRK
jgi:hypothetical protein